MGSYRSSWEGILYFPSGPLQISQEITSTIGIKAPTRKAILGNRLQRQLIQSNSRLHYMRRMIHLTVKEV
jgi:hypothetical protein